MILQSRRWRLLIRTIVLGLASVLMLAFAAPASYALQDDTPQLVTSANQLFDEEQPLAGAYIYTSSMPDLANIVTTESLGATYHWIVLPAYGNSLLIRTKGDNYLHAYYRAMDLNMDAAPREGNFYGKVTPLGEQAGADEAIDLLAAHNINLDKENTMVILQGEEPSSYRPMVPVVGLLALFWILALVGLFNILSGRRQRRRTRT
jgi:hypothetical protein